MVRGLLLWASLAFDIGMERTAASERGAMTMAALSCVAAVLTLALAARHGMGSRLRGPLPPLVRRPLPRAGVAAAQVCAGVIGIVLLTGLLARPNHPPLPQGWKIIRPGSDLFALAIDGKVVWAGGRAGLFGVDRNTLKEIAPDVAASQFRYIRDLAVDNAGGLWVAHGGGVTRIGETVREIIGAAQAYAVAVDRNGSVWMGAGNRLFVLRAGASEPVPVNHPLRAPVTAILEASDGRIWFGSDDPRSGGLASWDGSRWTIHTASLPHHSVNSIAEGGSGVLWFGTGFGRQGGAARLDGSAWSKLSQADGLAGAKTRSVFADQVGRVWFGSEYDGVAVFTGGVRRVMTQRDGLAGVEVKEIVQDREGVYWLATEQGLSRIDRLEPIAK